MDRWAEEVGRAAESQGMVPPRHGEGSLPALCKVGTPRRQALRPSKGRHGGLCTHAEPNQRSAGKALRRDTSEKKYQRTFEELNKLIIFQ